MKCARNIIDIHDPEKPRVNSSSINGVPAGLGLLSPPLIDIVIPWSGENNDTDVRQRDNQELKYALRGFWKHTPWVHKIYILQNGEPAPSWLRPEASEWIENVDRCTLFANKSHCPTKNGEAAQAVASYVRNLTEHFLMSDDDVFMIQVRTRFSYC